MAAIWVAAEAWQARRTRKEPDGGETLRVDDPPALVRTGAENGAPHEAHMQITSACALPCVNCHVEAHSNGQHVPLQTIQQRFKDLADRGVFHVAIGGGEGLQHPELAEIATAAHAAGLSIGLTTSGVGRLERAAGFDQVNVSFDGVGGHFLETRGYAGAHAAAAAIRALSKSNVRVGVNVLLTRTTFAALDETVAAAVAAGANDIHLLRLKPQGRAVAEYAQNRLTEAQGAALWPSLVRLMNEHPTASFRVDCALTPFLAAHGVSESRMRSFGWVGCHGGDALVAVNIHGMETPCSFSRTPLDPSTTKAWRAGVQAEPCRSCAYRDICRGGCHAVALATTGRALAPDPECPLVLAHEAAN